MLATKLKSFLDQEHVKYVTITHSPAYTSQEVAATAHVPGKDLAKTVMVKVDGRMVMAVLPATRHVHFEPLKRALGADSVGLASESEFRELFPECEVGAMPPFGNLYDMDVIVEESLTKDREIAFNAGSHTELVKLAYEDFDRTVHPRVVKF